VVELVIENGVRDDLVNVLVSETVTAYPKIPIPVAVHKRNPAGPQTLLDAAYIRCTLLLDSGVVACEDDVY
jgi:hypothetical protein